MNSLSNQDIKRLVLVVDDEFVNREMLGFIIRRDYNVINAKNGKEALELIRKHKQILSLVLLDLLMPVMDGFTVLKELQNDQELSKIPVIVLTSEKSAEIESLRLGAVDFITKPYDMPEVILARVRRSIELSEGAKMIQNTSRDETTGLLSKDFFFQFCERYDKYYPDEKMDAVAFNINHLSLINEISGRAEGTEIIKKIADAIKVLLNMTVGMACRFSDTFYLYMEHKDNCEDILRKFLNEFNSLFKNSRTRLVCGVNQIVDKKVDIYRRFERAMMACNSLKNNYHTNISFYDTELHKKELFEECLVADVGTSLVNKHFQVYYQPKYDISGSRPRLSSAEALIRWNHPEFGMVSPGTFIPLLEENGLVSKIDHFVWQEAASQVRRWRDAYNITVPVSVNLSRIDIYNPNLEENFIKLIETCGLTTRDIMLEVTESAYTDNSDQIIQVVESLRSKGFFIEMDDFGSGYSSLNMLSELPIDALKLDMKFIKNIATNPKALHMVELMMDVADFLKVSVVAEGVETEEQCRLLKQLKCNVIQGFYFSKPVPPEEFKLLIEKEVKARGSEAKEIEYVKC